MIINKIFSKRTADFMLHGTCIGCTILTFFDLVGCPMSVNGPSMEPTIMPGSIIWVSKLSLQPKLHEIFVFISPLDPARNHIKRVAALPGHIIKNKQGEYTAVPENRLWMLSDNLSCPVTLDSRAYGMVHQGLLKGKATHVIWPPSRWTNLCKTEETAAGWLKFTQVIYNLHKRVKSNKFTSIKFGDNSSNINLHSSKFIPFYIYVEHNQRIHNNLLVTNITYMPTYPKGAPALSLYVRIMNQLNELRYKVESKQAKVRVIGTLVLICSAFSCTFIIPSFYQDYYKEKQANAYKKLPSRDELAALSHLPKWRDPWNRENKKGPSYGE